MSRLPAAEGPDAPPVRCEIRVLGVLDEHWSAWFEASSSAANPVA